MIVCLYAILRLQLNFPCPKKKDIVQFNLELGIHSNFLLTCLDYCDNGYCYMRLLHKEIMFVALITLHARDITFLIDDPLFICAASYPQKCNWSCCWCHDRTHNMYLFSSGGRKHAGLQDLTADSSNSRGLAVPWFFLIIVFLSTSITTQVHRYTQYFRSTFTHFSILEVKLYFFQQKCFYSFLFFVQILATMLACGCVCMCITEITEIFGYLVKNPSSITEWMFDDG